ncbi:MAG: hypothetical protein EOP48_24350 [Sphingobacteriales bacterium]|nr:MAG: hypothetical protein EOP48_24350 [Sphingobacteriales bacterium]
MTWEQRSLQRINTNGGKEFNTSMEQIKKLVCSCKSILLVSFAFSLFGCISRKQDVAGDMGYHEIYKTFIDSNSRIRKTRQVRLISSYSAGKYGIEKLKVRIKRVRSETDPIVRVITLPEWSFSLDTNQLVKAPDKMIFIKREWNATDKPDRSERHYISPIIFSKDGID